MPFRPEHSLLRVEVPALHTIDTTSVENLFGMWSLFSKTSHAMEDGKRLENLSWRLWNRETFCCAPASKARASRPSAPIATSARSIPLPQLSSSLDSASSDEDLDSATASPIPAASRQELLRSDSVLSRGNEKHITPADLENIVKSIRDTPVVAPLDNLALPTLTADDAETSDMSDQSPDFSDHTVHPPTTDATPHPSSSRIALLEASSSTVGTTGTQESKTSPSQSFESDDTEATEMSTHSIVRGFVPGGAPSSYRSQTHLAPAQPTPILKSSPHGKHAKKKSAMFTIGTSSGEDESSLDSHMYKSSLSERLKRPANGSDSSGNSKKQTSFKDEIAIQEAADSAVFESDEEEDEGVSESAIEDDDDSSDWEDSDDASGPSSVNEKDMFQRVDSRPNLTSRRSLLTSLMHEPDRAKALANAASRSTPAMRRSRTSTPNGPSVAASPDPNAQIRMPGQQQPDPRGRPIIMTTSNTHPPQLALSPRTTRRNMLSTELTESLRKNLLWERQHRSTGNLAALKRRHTSNDVRNLRQHPEPGPVLSHQNPGRFTNDYFHAGLQEYHTRGW